MSTRSHATVVDPAALSPAACEAFIDELYAVHQEIFDGVDRDAFSRYVVRSRAERTRIEVYRADDRVVGYAAMHLFAMEVGGRACTVVRCEVGLLPQHRGRTRFGWFFAREALAQLLRAPGRPIYGLSCATSPATYRTLTTNAAQVWPHWSRATPPELSALMDELAERFELEAVDPDRPGVYHVGWQTRQDEQEVLAWQRSDHPASRYYLQRNPGYGDGHGLLVLVPMSPRDFVRSVGGLLVTKLRRAVRRRRAAAARPRRNSTMEASP